MMGRRQRAGTIIGLALLLTLTLGASRAAATFPGTDGLIAYISAGDIFLVDPASPSPQQITTGGGISSVNFNSTGTRLVADKSGIGVVFLDPVPGTAVTLLAGGSTADRNPSFDPTGTRVAFNNAGDIFVQDVNGNNRTNLTLANADTLSEPDWAPNGAFIALEDDTDFQVKRIDTAGGSLATITPPSAGCAAATPCQAPTVAPDSARVGYDQDGAPQGIYETLASGAVTSFRLTVTNDDIAAFSPQGDRVAYQDAASKLEIARTDGSAPAPLGFSTGRIAWGVRPPVPPVPPATPLPSNLLSLGKLKRNLHNGTAKLSVTVPGAGTLTLTGKGLVSQPPTGSARTAAAKAVAAAGTVKLTVKAKGTKKAKLDSTGKVVVKAKVTFTPTGGVANTATKLITLKKTL
jgi:Tol biopolymer transport system component